MARIVDREEQIITSDYGRRFLKGKWRKHKGVDLRSYTDDFRVKLPIVIPESAIFLRKVYQEEWAWTLVFAPIESGYDEIKFTHIVNVAHKFVVNTPYGAGTSIGYTGRTPHMIKYKYPEHLHYETWKGGVDTDPKIYMDNMGVAYEYKR